MNRARKFGVLAPTVYLIDEVERKIYMEYLGINSLTIKQFLYTVDSFEPSPSIALAFILFLFSS